MMNRIVTLAAALLLLLHALPVQGEGVQAPEESSDAKARWLISSTMGPPSEAAGVRFYIEKDGLYRITGEALEAAGLPLPVDAQSVRLITYTGEVPIAVNDGGDDELNAAGGDSIEFFGFHPRGEETTRPIYNVEAPYWLIVDEAVAHEWAPRLIGPPPPAEPETDAPVELGEPRRLEVISADRAREMFPNPKRYNFMLERRRLELDYFFRRWSGADPATTDYYYYGALDTGSHHRIAFDKVRIPGYAPPTADDPQHEEFLPQIRVRIFGISEAAPEGQADHVLEVSVNGNPVKEFAWDGIGAKTFETSFPIDSLSSGEMQEITLQTPDKRSDLVDLMYLDWVELTYPRSLDYAGGKSRSFDTEGMTDDGDRGVRINSSDWPESGVRVLDPYSGRLYEPTAVSADSKGRFSFEWLVKLPGGEAKIHGSDPFNSPELIAYFPAAVQAIETSKIELWNPSLPVKYLANRGARPANVILTHGSIMPEVLRLADYRAKTGLETLTVDVRDLFDAYTHGFHAKEAVVQFLRDLAASESGKDLRYLTLFGDSTFDYKGIQARYHPDRMISDANLLPIYYTEEGNWDRYHTVAFPVDHYFALLSGEDRLPDMAVGRIPAGNLEEARAYIDKVIEYETSPPNEEWRKRAVLVSSWERSFENLLRDASKELSGFRPEYLIAELESYEDDVKNLEQSLSNGCGILYYVGHGGSFVWRVGLIDFKDQKDLFTGDNVRNLENKGRYPLIFVSSCYTTSFDHARSLGESFLLEPDRGAIAVIGSPWKTSVSPNHQFNTAMMNYMYNSTSGERGTGETVAGSGQLRIGDAFLAAKRASERPSLAIIAFNLLGDPALTIDLP